MVEIADRICISWMSKGGSLEKLYKERLYGTEKPVLVLGRRDPVQDNSCAKQAG